MSEMQLVSWTDSTQQSGWEDANDLPKIADCTTIGFLVHEDDHQIVLAFSKDKTNGNLSGTLSIPKVAIEERSPVKAVDVRGER